MLRSPFSLTPRFSGVAARPLARLTALAVSRTGWIPATHFPVFPVSCFFLSLTICIASAQTNDPPKHPLTHLDSKLTRQLNELLWFQRLNDLAIVDTLHFAGPPPRATNGLAPPAGSNDVLISALTFLPRQRSHLRKLTLIVFAHGEIHGNVATDEPPLIVQIGRASCRE